ncbi:MAG: maleylpyruvate isomerase family mycothiol-dependent enzyme [Umezawaea sp.]
MTPPLAAVAEAHRTLSRALASLTDADVAGPSLLPGWTRGHVLAHVADAARARSRVVEHALRGEVVGMWEPGERDAIIEATAGRTADEHRAAVTENADRLERAWAAVADWSASGGFASAVVIRWREVWIHLVDLDVGVRPAAWPVDFSCHAVDFLRTRLPDGFAVRAVDSRGEGHVETPRLRVGGVEISGSVHDLAAWLAGRAPDEPPVSAVPLPELGPWPSYR